MGRKAVNSINLGSEVQINEVESPKKSIFPSIFGPKA